jgi:hypothetical protein
MKDVEYRDIAMYMKSGSADKPQENHENGSYRWAT